ncbi:hypothetical protein DSECCO2_260070 [anaerobic digester metagenome]
MNQRIKPDPERCRAVGLLTGTLRIRQSFYDRRFLKARLKKEAKLSMLFGAVAICHQTNALHSAKKNLSGWDYMEAAFLSLAEQSSWLLEPTVVAQTNKNVIRKALLTAFSDSGHAGDSTLDRIDERADLYQDLCKMITRQYGGKFGQLLASSKGLLISNGGGFYELLAASMAFGDPVRKKSSFLFKLLYDSGLYTVNDPENFVPIMDYHMQRVLLRMGCLIINDKILEEKLISGAEMQSDEPVRSACIEALKIIAIHSGFQPWVMNDFFWSLGRSCCNETTLCSDHFCIKKPCTFHLMTEISDHSGCAFASCCLGNNDIKYRSFREPNVKTHYY